MVDLIELTERVARSIAKRHGDDFDAIPKDKPDWTFNRGHFSGRFRDVNEPYQSDYLDMADAAIDAMPGWEPIATAPRDVPFLAWQGIERGPFKCWWHDDLRYAYWMDSADTEPSPTHWQPLPAPPDQALEVRR